TPARSPPPRGSSARTAGRSPGRDVPPRSSRSSRRRRRSLPGPPPPARAPGRGAARRPARRSPARAGAAPRPPAPPGARRPSGRPQSPPRRRTRRRRRVRARPWGCSRPPRPACGWGRAPGPRRRTRPAGGARRGPPRSGRVRPSSYPHAHVERPRHSGRELGAAELVEARVLGVSLVRDVVQPAEELEPARRLPRGMQVEEVVAVIAVDVAGIHPVRPHLAPLDGGAHGEGRRVVAEPHAADAPRRALLLLSAEVDLLVRPPA